jgi:hypothetical protein
VKEDAWHCVEEMATIVNVECLGATVDGEIQAVLSPSKHCGQPDSLCCGLPSSGQ